jgi:hypothetical protein
MKFIILSEKDEVLLKRWYRIFLLNQRPYKGDLALEKKLFNTQSDPEEVLRDEELV